MIRGDDNYSAIYKWISTLKILKLSEEDAQ